VKWLLVALLLLGAAPVQAQFLPTKEWWHNPTLNFLDQHPIAHSLGGIGLDLGSRIFAGRKHSVKRCLAVGAIQGFWEAAQLEMTPGYSRNSAAWDLVTAETFCWVTEGFIKVALRR
jgi:hypothetical protein